MLLERRHGWRRADLIWRGLDDSAIASAGCNSRSLMSVQYWFGMINVLMAVEGLLIIV